MTKLIVANWKMAMGLSRAEAFFSGIEAANFHQASVVICPSFPLLNMVKAHGISVGAQTCSDHESGAYTGETSASLLKDMGCSYVLVGHSERRTLFGEVDEIVKAKAEQVLAAGMVPIVCIGESLETYEKGETQAFLREQLKRSLPEDRCIVAYEPIWAIGTGKTPTIREIEEMHAFLKDEAGMPLLYGGSVNEENAEQILNISSVDGVLVGGASLCPDKFSKIIRSA